MELPLEAPLEQQTDAPAPKKTLWELLRQRFPEREYALFPEVRNATGFKANRSADALAMGLWPSRGIEVIGFEFKAYRSDWIRELKDPAKAEVICAYCDRWYVVADGTDIVKREEMPKTWGLLVRTDKGVLRAQVEAPKLEPKPMDRSFIAAVLRAAQAQGTKPLADLRSSIREELHREMSERHRKDIEQTARTHVEATKRLVEQIRAFEDASGIKIANGWGHASAGAAVRFLTENRLGVRMRAENIVNSLGEVVANARAALADLDNWDAEGTQPPSVP